MVRSLLLTSLGSPARIGEQRCIDSVKPERGAAPAAAALGSRRWGQSHGARRRPLCPSVLPSSEQLFPRVSASTLSPASEPPHGAQKLRIPAGAWITWLCQQQRGRNEASAGLMQGDQPTTGGIFPPTTTDTTNGSSREPNRFPVCSV